MSDIRPAARAITLPAGSLAPTHSLKDGEHEIEIISVRDNNEMTLMYPQGWQRDHQAAGIEELVTKVVMNLRARYGVKAVRTLKICPLEKGGKLIMEVSNDDTSL